MGLWGDDLPIQRCTVHKHRNLLAHAPRRLHDELTEDYRDMIYADTTAEVEERRKAFVRKWRLKCRAVADSLEEAGAKLFSFIRLDPSQWRSARTTNAIERLNEEFRRRIKTQNVLPCAETMPRLLWALLASGQIQMRKVDGWEPRLSLSSLCTLTSLLEGQNFHRLGERHRKILPHSRHDPDFAVVMSDGLNVFRLKLLHAFSTSGCAWTLSAPIQIVILGHGALSNLRKC